MKYTRLDFSVINENVRKIQTDLSLKSLQDAFYFFILDLLFNLQPHEIENLITDSDYLSHYSGRPGHDRGIDAVYIEEGEKKHIVHLFNFKYCNTFEKTFRNFPGSEIDKITMFITTLFEEHDDKVLKASMNPLLYEKVQEIWELQNNELPDFVIHLVSNTSLELEKIESSRFQKQMAKYRSVEIDQLLATDIVNKVTRRERKVINAKVQVSKKELFEQAGGDIRALIINLSVRDCIRIVLNDENIRLKANTDNYRELQDFEISEDAFEDNVRVYLKQRPRINQNIKRTVLSEESSRFFYYNNGITITCSEFIYPPEQRHPLIELKNIQVVNGSQTIHALYDALLEDYAKLENAYILCRIYELKNPELSARIAQYTNSQNPVNNRDIKSIDYVQLKLENEFKVKGLYYERKKNQYQDKQKSERLDSEKVGQILMSFYNRLPFEAKNNKSLIFADKYEEVFNENINADKVLLAYRLFDSIEKKKNKRRLEIFATPESYQKLSYLLYASFYILFVIGELCDENSTELKIENFDKIEHLYATAIDSIEQVVEIGRKKSLEANRSFAYNTFFKSNNPKIYFEELKKRLNLKELPKL